MFRPLSRSHRRPPRRGTSFILIVVVMLSLFSAVGTAYALFAMREAKLSLARKDAEGGGTSAQLKAPDPTDTINRFFGTLIYDVGDSGTDLTNGLRGHSLARSMYGRDVTLFLPTVNQPPTTPWNGVGLFSETNVWGNRAQQVNNTVMSLPSTIPIPPNTTPTLLTVLFDPEYTGQRGIDPRTGALLPFDPTTRTYYSKAAGYSFPDLKDFFLAQLDPVTGEVLVPSFHRPWLFGSLRPDNAYWYNYPTVGARPEGKLLTMRPRYGEHPQFPRVPPDRDGVSRGDVQNLPGGYKYDPATNTFFAINDSIWINLNLPVITLPGNRKVQPMVAPLIVPLNQLFNTSAHGNNYFAGAHGSYHGFGPWEVNMGAAIPANEAAAIVTARGLNQQRWQAGVATPPFPSRRFNPSRVGPFSSHAPVAWDNSGVPSMTYPTGASFAGLPSFSAAFKADNADAQYHPSLFKSDEWPGSTAFANRVFPLGDAKRLLTRYAGTPDWYAQSEVAPLAPFGLKGDTNTYGYTIATGQLTAHANRLDPAHANRLLFAPYTYDLDRPKVVPNFASRDATTALSYLAATGKLAPVSATPYPDPGSVGQITDFAAGNRWSNALARLGSVNVNRPLTDYRTDSTKPLSAANLGNRAQADSDRQALARDILTRLVAAMGAAGYINPGNGALFLPDPTTRVITLPGNAGTAGPFTQQQYDALRYLAQLAVNIVDYVDDDDISTAFVWNPNANGTADFTSAIDVGNRVVFGHEKPRLVISESYIELVNDPADPVDGPIDPATMMQQTPQKPAQARVFAELANPTTVLNPNTGPLGDGTVALNAYQIQISRANRGALTGAPAAQQGNLSAFLTDPANVTGRLGNAAGSLLPDATFTFTGAAGQPTAVAPNNGVYSPAVANLPASGFVLVGPPAPAKQGSEEFAPPNTAGTLWSPTNKVESGPLADATTSTGMGYTFPLPAANQTLSDAEFKQHIVTLRRAANPYLAPNDPASPTFNANAPVNPYVTVDVMDYVPGFDAVHRGKNDGKNRGARDATNNPMGYDPVADANALLNRFSVGKVQPYAGRSVATPASGPGVYNTYTFPLSMVLNQRPANPTVGEPRTTFGRHNGTGGAPGGSTFVPATTAPFNPSLRDPVTTNTETVMAPFDWMVHLDRPLISTAELLQVRDTPSFRVTDKFIVAVPTAAPGIGYDAGYAPWLADGVARGLEYLAVKPHTSGVPHGGRVAGKVNVNGVPDRRIIQGLFDAPAAGTNPNGFDVNWVNNNAWTGWIGSRNGVKTSTTTGGASFDTADAAGASVFDMNATSTVGAAPLSRPFLSLGAPAATASATATAFGSGGNVDHTMLRRPNATSAPYLYTTVTAQGYMQSEALRKVMNNTTTVNHQYAVFLTIGYFDVVGTVQLAPGYNIPQVGAEAFIAVPGDMRQKVVGVVDMSQMALKPVYPAAPGDTDPHATEVPFFTSLEQTAYPLLNGGNVTLNIACSRYDATAGSLYVASNGQEVAIGQGKQLVIGYGAEEQVVTVQGVAGMTATGVGQVSVAGLVRTAWGGSCVSNVRPGYPGPQPGFAYTDPKYKGVLPFLERLK